MISLTDKLLDRFLDGDTGEAEQQRVIAWLEVDEHHMLRLAERAELHADLRRSLQRRRIQQGALSVLRQPPVVHPSHGSGQTNPRRQKTLTYALAVIALAASASLMISFIRTERTAMKLGTSRTIATLAYQSHARWADGDRSEGDFVGVGTLTLDVGLVRLDFANGATVTLQGPAAFDVLGIHRTRLQSGILTAYIPDSAVGFEVETPSLEVVDLGTAFGVSVGSDGETDVCVFEGEVEVSFAGHEEPPPQRVVEGSAVRRRLASGGIQTVEFQAQRFEDSWSITAGVLQATGLMKLVSPGPRFIPGHYEDNEHILVFPERSQIVLERDVAVDLVEPGQYQRIHGKEQQLVTAGNRVRSYLIQLDPTERSQRKEPGKSRVMGQITFDRPIVGLIGSGTKLSATDGILGHPRGAYGDTPRGIEPFRPTDPPESGRDVVTLSSDRRTLSLDLSAGSAVDQIRVVVSESASE